MNEIEIDQAIVKRLQKKIVIKENQNLNTKVMSDQQMVKWIKDRIEEELKCFSNQ